MPGPKATGSWEALAWPEGIGIFLPFEGGQVGTSLKQTQLLLWRGKEGGPATDKGKQPGALRPFFKDTSRGLWIKALLSFRHFKKCKTSKLLQTLKITLKSRSFEEVLLALNHWRLTIVFLLKPWPFPHSTSLWLFYSKSHPLYYFIFHNPSVFQLYLKEIRTTLLKPYPNIINYHQTQKKKSGDIALLSSSEFQSIFTLLWLSYNFLFKLFYLNKDPIKIQTIPYNCLVNMSLKSLKLLPPPQLFCWRKPGHLFS